MFIFETFLPRSMFLMLKISKKFACGGLAFENFSKSFKTFKNFKTFEKFEKKFKTFEKIV